MRDLLKTTFLGSMVTLALTITATPASAALIVSGGLSLETNPTDFYQQTTSSPCVIGGNKCQNPVSFLYTDAAGGGGGEISQCRSPFYDVDQITAISGGPNFFFGLDYNEAKGDKDGPQTLFYFQANYYIVNVLLSS